jgi:two-component system, NarL family, response regulator NreC
MAEIRIFIVDDHRLFRDAARLVLQNEREFDVVGESAGGPETMDEIIRAEPDVVLVDVVLPSASRVTVAAEIMQALPATKIVALSGLTDPMTLRAMVAAGASAYVAKHSHPSVLFSAIRAAVDGHPFIDPYLGARSYAEAFAMGAKDLSDREEHVARASAQGFSNGEIAAQLGVSVKTVETYKTRFMRKAGIATRPQLVTFAVQRGWIGPQQTAPFRRI